MRLKPPIAMASVLIALLMGSLPSRILAQSLGCSDSDFVRKVFLDLLDRPVDAGSLNVFSPGGTLIDTRANVAFSILKSDERLSVLVDSYYQTFLGRQADAEGRSELFDLLRHGASGEEVIAVIVGSPEYIQRALTLTTAGLPAAWISQSYLDVLHRSPDPAAVRGFSAYLNSGGAEEQVAIDLVSSNEYRTALINGFYQKFLNRSADQPGLNGLLGLLGNGGSTDDVIAAIIGSPEYCSRSAPVVRALVFTRPTTLIHDANLDLTIPPPRQPIALPQPDPKLPLFPDISVLVGQVPSLVRSVFGFPADLEVADAARDLAQLEVGRAASTPGADSDVISAARIAMERGLTALAAGRYPQAARLFAKAYRTALRVESRAPASEGGAATTEVEDIAHSGQ